MTECAPVVVTKADIDWFLNNVLGATKGEVAELIARKIIEVKEDE